MRHRFPLLIVGALALALLPGTRAAMAQVSTWTLTQASLAQAAGGQAGGGQAGGQAGGGQAGGTTTGGGEPPVTPPPAAAVEAPPAEVKGKPTTNEEAPLKRFGDEFFAPSRQAIAAAKAKAISGAPSGNAFEGPAGPISLGNINATPPETYQLGSGDKITLRVSTPFVSPTETKITIDSVGSIIVPQSGRKLVLRGQTLTKAEELLTAEIGRYLRSPQVSVVLDELRTFTINVLGESFAPGSYQVPATFSLFNLIMATGGPTDKGSMRSIQLRRNNAPAKSFDLYRFLISGDAKQDTQLQPGDVVFYPVAQGQASIEGEVNRPGVFELAGNETLGRILQYAGGIRPSGVAQNVAIDSIVPGSERRLLNINLANRTPSANPPILDGDKIRIFSIRAVIRNAVTISGPVEQPRTYAFKPGQTVKDLINLALGLRPEADKSIAELRRVASDGTQSLIRVDLAKALKGDRTANLELSPNDTLTIFDVNDLSWRGERKVQISGAVRTPGEYYRADGMRVGDLLRQARGLEPIAYADEAHLQRYNPDGTPGPLVKINLSKAALGDKNHDIALADRDRLRVYTLTEWQAVPDQAVSVSGAVQRPGNFPLAQGMTVRDLLEQAGRFTLQAHTTDAFLQRVNSDGTLGPVLLLDPSKALLGDPAHNFVLQSRDSLKLFTTGEWKASPEDTVGISGAVQRPASYGLAKGMTVKDLIGLAGGPALNAYLDRAFLQRTNADGTLGALQVIDIAKALSGDAKENVVLQSRDKLSVYSIDQAKFLIDRTVTILGGVQRPGTYPRGDGMTLEQLVAIAGGVLPNSESFAIIAKANVQEGADVERVPLQQALNQVLADKDTVTIPIDASILAEPIQVVIRGAVANPGTYFFTRKDQRVSDLVKQAGGLRPEAWVIGTQLARRPDFLRTESQTSQQPRLIEVLRLIQDDEYKRAVAKAEIDRLIVINSANSSGSPFNISSNGQPTSGETTAAPAETTLKANELVTPARKSNSVDGLIGGNVTSRVDLALRRPGSFHDFVLKPGDVITVPDLPSTVVLDGPGIVLPQAFIFEPNKTLKYYITKAGGLTVDADPNNILIVRPGGSLLKPKAGTTIQLGDVIFVPTKIMVAPVGSKREDFDRVVKTVTNTALLYGIFRSFFR